MTKAISRATALGMDAILLGTDTTILAESSTLGQLTLAAKLPAISPFIAFPEGGGLLAYGSNLNDQGSKSADYVAAVLNGAKISDLPVLSPTVYDFELNLRTAKAIGITIPQSILVQATQVIS